jgi:hypothetical protein
VGASLKLVKEVVEAKLREPDRGPARLRLRGADLDERVWTLAGWIGLCGRRPFARAAGVEDAVQPSEVPSWDITPLCLRSAMRRDLFAATLTSGHGNVQESRAGET